MNPMQIVNLSEHTKSRLIKFIEAVKRFSEKWFSHVLLLMFLAVYACFGAYIFISFEAPTEQWEKQVIIDTRQRIVNESWQDAHDKSREEFFDLYRTKFEDYERLLNRVCQSGMTSSSLENQWTFWGALFYSMTVFTTIGYGHLTPITFAGRVATMVYAIFGIPILLMVLADLGKLLTRIIKFTFKKFRYLYNKLLGRKASIRTRKLISDNTSQYIGVARDAFERGFAYIQPYNKIPMAFRNVSFRSRGRGGPSKGGDVGAGGDGDGEVSKRSTGNLIQEAEEKVEANEAGGVGHMNPSSEHLMKKHSVTTDVIVTPGKQTKPVSPVGDEKDKHPLSLRSTISHETNNNSQGHSQQPQEHKHQQGDSKHHDKHHNRSHSPGAKSKDKHNRKISSSKQTNKQQVVTAAAASVSKSSTASNIPATLGGPPVSTDQAAAKLPDRDLSLPAPTRNTNQEVPSAVSAPITNSEEIRIDLDTKVPMVGEMLDTTSEEEAAHLQFEDEEEDLDEDDFDIPVSFALFLLVTYMMFGAVVFSIWEGWNFFDALYFVFISMSTIGFGDLVPQHPKRMIGTFIYLLLGLALTSMCINVVQEKIHATFLRAKMQIGEKMGLDLDQIMADDYYEGSLGMEGGNAGSNGDEDDAHSVAVSQTNSTYAPVSTDHYQDDVDSPTRPIAEPGIKQSRSKESLKNKRKSGAGLSDGSTGGGSGGIGGSGSVRRKPSRKISRNQQPPSISSNQTVDSLQNHQQQQRLQRSSISDSPKLTSPELEYIKAEQQSVAFDSIAPSLNIPVSSIGGVCRPLERNVTPNNDQRPKLVATRSQPTVTKSLSSENNRICELLNLQPSTGGSNRQLVRHNAINDNLNNNNSTDNNNIAKYGTTSKSNKSEGSSRRASVSNELNQLDDLIKVLSRTPSERFGPLLGVPSSSRSSRSGSPSSSLASRRGTSMTYRRPNTTSPRPGMQKEGSLVIPSSSSFNNAGELHPTISRQSQLDLEDTESFKHQSAV